MHEEDISLKILILGDSGVGKRTLTLKYVDGFFPEFYISTIGVEYKTKLVKINDTNIMLQIWQTCGQERYKSLSKSFIKDSDGIIFIYDISNKCSFDIIEDWVMESECSNIQIQKIIVGNKIDLPETSREVPKEKLIKYNNNTNSKGIEVSAKTGENVEEAFLMLTKLIVGNMTKEEIIKRFKKKSTINLKLSDKRHKKGSSC